MTYIYSKQETDNTKRLHTEECLGTISKQYIGTISKLFEIHIITQHICDMYENIWEVYGTDKRRRKQVNQLQVFEIDQSN